jgi:hypothetical protein
MRKQKLAAGERELTRLSPTLVLSDASELYAYVVYLVALDLVRQAQRVAVGSRLLLDMDSELSHELQESYHGVVELPMHEWQAQGHIA